MPPRTGEQFLAGLRGARAVRLEGHPVADVTCHPALAGAAHTLAAVFDLQHSFPDDCLAEGPGGHPIPVSHLIPRSRGDLQRRHAGLQRVAEFTAGLMGRTPDYLNVTFAGFAARPDEWSMGDNAAGAAALLAFQREIAVRDLALTHTIIHPTVDRAQGDAPAPGNTVALRRVGSTAGGVVVRGARVLATLAPFADEIAVYPGHPLPPGADDYALAFSIPLSTPGLTILCRDSFSRCGSPFDHPLSGRFDEQDAFVVFDDVTVPRDRLFVDANLAAYNTVMRTSWFPNVAQQTMIRAQTRLEFAYGLGCRMAEVLNDTSPATNELLGEIWTYAEFARAAVRTAEEEAADCGTGAWFPSPGPMNALRAALPRWFPRVNEILRLVGSHNLLATPAHGDLADPAVGPLVDHYLHGAADHSARERVSVFRLAWDFVASDLGGRNEQYERFYLASAARCHQLAHAAAPRDRARLLVDQFLAPPTPYH
ncbi:MAG: 4-hydroxyphenylacetate 3-hydroxylase [Gemmataceae bacterium]|nr:4-hydroxyphenylacetate 3-hydroxylase [Gemmataceae bacterium]